MDEELKAELGKIHDRLGDYEKVKLLLYGDIEMPGHQGVIPHIFESLSEIKGSVGENTTRSKVNSDRLKRIVFPAIIASIIGALAAVVRAFMK